MKVSIIMPTYNRPTYIKGAVKSILSQSYTDWELIIKEGGPGLGYSAVNNLLVDKRIIYVYSHDTGISNAFNTGLKLASGEIFMWANDDDILLSNTINLVINNIKQYQWGYGRIKFIKNGKPVSDFGHAGTLDQLKRGNFIPQPAVFWTRQAFERIGYMNETYKFSQDYDYWLRLMKEYPDYYYTDEILAHYNLHDDQILTKYKSEQLQQAEAIARSI